MISGLAIAASRLDALFVDDHAGGPMEKAVDNVVARRFKARGMSWFRRGVSALVRLRLLRLNGTWARDWSERFAARLRPWPSTV